MEKQFVSLKIARKLRTIGFNEPCIAKYCKYNSTDPLELRPQSQNFFKGYFNVCVNDDKEKYSAPVYSQVIPWLSDKYHIYIAITVNAYSSVKEVFGYKIYNEDLNCVDNKEDCSMDYFEAQEAAILSALKIVMSPDLTKTLGLRADFLSFAAQQ